jgi:hypothetical protein
MTSHTHYTISEEPTDEIAGISTSFLCAKIASAFSQGRIDNVCDLTVQLSTHISIDSPTEIPGLVDTNLMDILLSLLQLDTLPRTIPLTCLVNIASITPGYPFLFESHGFLSFVIHFFERDRLTDKEIVCLLSLLRNIVYNGSRARHSLICDRFPIARLSAITATTNGEVVIAVLDCLKQIAKFPVNSEAFRGILSIIRSTRDIENAGIYHEDYVHPAVWTLIHLIRSGSFTFDVFVEMGFVPILQTILESPSAKAVAVGSRLMRLLVDNFQISEHFRIACLVEIVLNSKNEEHAALCAFAMGSVLQHQADDALQYLQTGLLGQLLALFGRRGIRCKVAFLRIFLAMAIVADESTFPVLLQGPPGTDVTVFGLCSELLETDSVEAWESCLQIFIAILEKARDLGMMAECRELFQNSVRLPFPSDEELLSDPVILPLLERLGGFGLGENADVT